MDPYHNQIFTKNEYLDHLYYLPIIFPHFIYLKYDVLTIKKCEL